MQTPVHDPAPADQAAEFPESVPADGEGLRGLLRQMASPVVVVTCRGESGPRGATIGSFASASLSPPLVTFNVTHGTRFHEAIETAESFAVHLLASDQSEVATRFAIPDLDAQLDTVDHAFTARGLPLLDGTLGVLLCRPQARVEAGDHTLVVGRVEEILPGREGEPLLYFQQSYRGVGREV
ncbi:MAG: flavin reductase family protein [Bacteroidota bacterium]